MTNKHHENRENVNSNNDQFKSDQQDYSNIESRSFSNHEPQLLSDKRDEEIATELSPDNDMLQNFDADDDMGVNVNSAVGWIAVALSIISFFMLPIIFGGAGIILGFVARKRDAQWLGNTAIAAGVISIVINLFISPFI